MTFFFFLVVLSHLGNRKKIRQERRKSLLLLGVRKISSINKQTTFSSTQISSPPQPQAVKFNMQLDPQSTWLCKACLLLDFLSKMFLGNVTNLAPLLLTMPASCLALFTAPLIPELCSSYCSYPLPLQRGLPQAAAAGSVCLYPQYFHS